MLGLLFNIAGLVTGLGLVGLAILFFAMPAAFAVVMRVAERVLDALIATRLGCMLLAVLLVAPITYWIGTFDESAKLAARDAQAAAALAERIAGAARLAAGNDQARAAAAAALAQHERDRADALARKIAEKPCLDPADTDELRRLWRRPHGPAKRRPATAPRSIEGLLERG